MKRIAFVLVLVALIAGGLSCSSSTSGGAEQALEQFYRHLNDGSYPDARELYTAEVQGEIADVSSTDFAAWAQGETKRGQFKRIRVVEQESESDSAKLQFHVEYADGSKSELRSVSLTLESGQWRLGFIQAAGSATLAPPARSSEPRA